MKKILVSGGSYPDNWKSIQDKHEENFIRFDKAQMLILDWDSGELVKEINYRSPDEYLNPSLMFKVCDLTKDSVIPVTNTEIVEYNRESMEVSRVISHPSFNDLHSVKKVGDKYYVVNTGLEMLQIVDKDGVIQKEYNIATRATWDRFSKDVDYRHTGSTKPHEIHVNNVFIVDDKCYVTRMKSKDAVNVEDPTETFDIEVGNPHDGVIHDDLIFFTTTNGHVVVFDKRTRRKLQTIDINALLDKSEFKSGGWCRGILPLSKTRLLIGYTQLRHTKFKEFVSWAKKLGDSPAPTRILEIDLEENNVTKEVVYPTKGGSAIFSIIEL